MASVQTTLGAGHPSDVYVRQPTGQEAELAEEELEDVPHDEKVADPLYRLQLGREVNGQILDAVVDDIEVGVESRERLYLIRYADGDIEHLTAAEVRECAKNDEHLTAAEPDDEVDESHAEPATKKRPSAAVEEPSAKAKKAAEKPMAKAAEKPSAKAKAKASPKKTAQPAGKKAAAKVVVVKKPARK